MRAGMLSPELLPLGTRTGIALVMLAAGPTSSGTTISTTSSVVSRYTPGASPARTGSPSESNSPAPPARGGRR